MEPKLVEGIADIGGTGTFQRKGYPFPRIVVDTEEERFCVWVEGYGFLTDGSARLMTWKTLETLKRSLSDYAVQNRYGLGLWQPANEPAAKEARGDTGEKSKYLPDWLRRKIVAAFNGQEMMTRPGYFVIWDETANNALGHILGIVTGEQPEYDYGAFKVRFDWNLQRFIVTA